MTLEQAVKNEIDRWDITLRKIGGGEISYEHLVRPTFYGIAITIAEETRKSLVRDNEKYLAFTYHNAVEQFRKDFLLYHLKKHQFDVKETAQEILSSANIESNRTALHNRVKELFGIPVKELQQKIGRDYQLPKETPTPEELQEEAVSKIKEYANLFRVFLLRQLLIQKAPTIAQRMYKVTTEEVDDEGFLELNDIFEEKYLSAVDRFKEWYINQQIKRSKDGVEAAHKCGLDAAAFRQWLFRRNKKMADFEQKSL